MNSIQDAEIMAQITHLYIEVAGEVNSHKKLEELNDALSTYPPCDLIRILNEAKDKKKGWRWCEVELEKSFKKRDPDKFIQGKYGENVLRDGEDILKAWEARKHVSNR